MARRGGLRGISKEDRPRERLAKYGAGHLTDEELMMVLLGSGTQGMDVAALAREIVKIIDARKRGEQLSLEELCSVHGMGQAKAMHIIAAYEFVRRRYREDGIKIQCPSDVYPMLRHYGAKRQEHFICVTLNGANIVMQVHPVTKGLLNRTQVHPREVFAAAIEERAASIILAHNHPSGNLEPSRDDLAATKRLKEAGELLGIPVLDHLIFSNKSYYSLADHNQL